MILTWQNHVGAFVGAHRYLTVGLFEQLPQYAGISVAVEAPPTGKGRARIRFIDRAVLVRDITFRVPDLLVTADGLTQVQAGVVAPALPGAFAPQITFEPFVGILPDSRRITLNGITFQVPNMPVELTAEEKELLLLYGLRSRDD